MTNQLLIECIDRRLGCVLLLRQRVSGRKNMVGAETEINGTHLLKTPQQQTGSHEQHQSHGDFTNH